MNNWQEFENKSPNWKNEGEEPPQVRKTEGYAAGWTVPAGWLNWFWARVSKCLTELQSKVKGLWQGVQALETGETIAGKAKNSEKLGGQLPAWYMPTGAIMPYGGGSAPSGFLLCNGQTVSRSTYANLFAVCGTLYGTGNGSTTFNLPNMNGRFALGAGGGFSRGWLAGEVNHSLSIAEMPAHNLTPGRGGRFMSFYGSGLNEGMGYAQGDTVGLDWATNVVGGSQTHNNMPPYLALSYIMKT